jgi:beta-lactamase class A
LARLFSGEPLAEEWFVDEFLSAVPTQQLEELITSIETQAGEFQRIEGEESPFTIIFTLGTVVSEIYLDEEGRIAGLFFQPVTMNVTDLNEALTLIEELPGDVSVLITKDDAEQDALNADAPLGVGSAFKLAVLAKLREQIESGLHTWDEVVPLAPEWKGPPSSMLKDWPDDSPVTLHTLATLMISISDNTATDALIDIVGREEIEELTPHNRPLLTVRELFMLKTSSNAELLERYRNGNEAEKRQVLEELATLPLPPLEEVSQEPILDVEWMFTASELCDLITMVEDLDLTTVSPGPAGVQQDRWSRISFKGGSELGVLNLTTWLETEDGATYCVTMTQNNPDGPIGEDAFVSLYLTLISLLE